MRTSSKKSSASKTILATSFLAADLARGAEKKAPAPAPRVTIVSPAPNTMTDGNFCDVDVAVPAGSPVKKVEFAPEGEQDGIPLQFPVEKGHAKGKVPLAPGKNTYAVVTLNAAGRRMKAASFRVFRTSNGSSGEYVAMPQGKPAAKGLSYLQPGANTSSGGSSYTAGPYRHCGYPANSTMSISIPSENGGVGTSTYVTTDSHGCFTR
jgi:hypothetical protein